MDVRIFGMNDRGDWVVYKGLFIACLSVFIVGCTSENTIDSENKADEGEILTEIVRDNRTQFEVEVLDESEMFYEFNQSESRELTEEELEALRYTGEIIPFVTREQMIEDVHMIHDTFKFSYALYKVVGWYGELERRCAQREYEHVGALEFQGYDGSTCRFLRTSVQF